MSEEKKVKFSGDVSGLTSAFQKLRDQAKQINKDLAADAAKHSESTKEQIKYIEDEIRAIGRRNAADKKSRQEAIRGSYDDKINSTNIPYLKDNLKKQKQNELLGVQKEYNKTTEQTRLLKELLEETKKSARHQILSDKEKAARESETILADKTGVFSPEEKLRAGLIADQLKKGEEKPKKKDKEESTTSAFMRAFSGERAIRSLDTALGATVGANSREGVVKMGLNIAGGVINSISTGLKSIPLLALLGGATDVAAKNFAEGYERHVGEKHAYEQSKFSLGALTDRGSDLLQKRSAMLLGLESEPRKSQQQIYNESLRAKKGTAGHVVEQGFMAPIGEAINGLIGKRGYGDYGVPSDFLPEGMSQEEWNKIGEEDRRIKKEESRRGAAKIANEKRIRDLENDLKSSDPNRVAFAKRQLRYEQEERSKINGQGVLIPSALEKMGVTQPQFFDSQKQILRGSNSANNLGTRTLTQLGLERGYGVDAGVMNARTAMEMVSGETNYTKIVGTLEQLKKISPANNTALTKFIEAQTNFIGLSMKQNQKINQDVTTNRILSLDKLGGSFRFNDPRFMEGVGKINDMITNPSNDFKQAASFSILRDTLGPNAGITDLLKTQQQGFGGASGGKLLQGWIDMSKRSGDKQSQILALSSAGGFSIEEAEKLLNYQNQDFSKMKGVDLNKILGRAEGFTTQLDKDSALISSAFVTGATDGIVKVAELFGTKLKDLMETYLKGGNKPKGSK